MDFSGLYLPLSFINLWSLECGPGALWPGALSQSGGLALEARELDVLWVQSPCCGARASWVSCVTQAGLRAHSPEGSFPHGGGPAAWGGASCLAQSQFLGFGGLLA